MNIENIPIRLLNEAVHVRTGRLLEMDDTKFLEKWNKLSRYEQREQAVLFALDFYVESEKISNKYKSPLKSGVIIIIRERDE